jgi:hypothetical protein
MNENQQNFDDLKRMLKLKRHEVPPPGYFNNFSDNVVSRLRSGEGSRGLSLVERLQVEASWLASFLRIFETKPGVIGASATALCLLLVAGVVFADYSERSNKKVFELADPSGQPANNSVASLTAPMTSPLVAGPDSGGIVASTNPVTSLQPTMSLLGQPGTALFQTAGFAPSH